MAVRFVDANVFLRALTGSEPAQAAAARSLLLRVEAGTEHVTTSPLVLFEVIFTLHSPRSYNHPKERIVELLLPLFDLRGLKVANKPLWRQAFQTWLSYPIDFTDAYNVAAMRSQHVSDIYTWDRGFDSVPHIHRLRARSASHRRNRACCLANTSLLALVLAAPNQSQGHVDLPTSHRRY